MKNKCIARPLALVMTLILLLSIISVVGAQSNGEGEESLGENFFCLNRNEQHPVGARLAEHYDLPYEVVMDWFCDGFGFGQIKMALKLASAAGVSPDELLQRRSEGAGWGVIRKELGLTGLQGNGHRIPFKHHGHPPWAGRPGGPWGENPPVPDD